MKLYNATYYHGSGTTFDKFDFQFMSTGEGQQVHGWGIYLAKRKTTARGYRNNYRNNTYVYKFLFTYADGTSKEYRQVRGEKLRKGTMKGTKMDLSNPYDFIAKMTMDFSTTYFYHKYYNKEMLNDFERKIKNILMDSFWKSWYGFPRETVEKVSDVIGNIVDIKYSKEIITDSMLATVHVERGTYITESMYVEEMNKTLKDKFIRAVDKLGYFKILKDKRFESYVLYDMAHDLNLHFSIAQRVYRYLSRGGELNVESITDVLKEGPYSYDGEDVGQIAEKIIAIWNKANDETRYDIENESFQDIRLDLENSGVEPKDFSMALLEQGIDGVKYYGSIDGDCMVLFNLDKCQIVEKE